MSKVFSRNELIKICEKQNISLGNLKEFTIPDGFDVISECAFEDCKSLKKVNISDSVTKIGDFAFFGDVSLEEITIPDSVTKIGESAFMDCYSLKEINIPDSVTTIGDDAFMHCKSLKKVIIPDGVTRIGNSAFAGCKSLEKIITNEEIFNQIKDNLPDNCIRIDSESAKKKSKHNGKLSFDEQVFPEISSEDMKKLESLKDSGYDKSAIEEPMMFDETTENQNDRSILD